MTPEATIGMLHMLDHWKLMLAQMQGQPLPPLPNLPGRRIVAHDEPLSDDELQGVTSPTELGLICGISRQAAAYRIARRALADGEGSGDHD